MPQLVGRTCTLCQVRVPSELEGHFCRGCGNPVHNACVVKSHEPGKCPACGTSHQAASVTRAKEQQEREASRRLVPPPPLSAATGVRLVRSVQVLLAGTAALGLGIGLLCSPDLRGDPNQLSAAEVVRGVGTLLVGVVILGFGCFWLRPRD